MVRPANTGASKLPDNKGDERHHFSSLTFRLLFLFFGIPAMVVFAWVISFTIKHDTAFDYFFSLVVAIGTDFFFFICVVLAVGKLVGWALIIRYGREERTRQKRIKENVQEIRTQRLEMKAQNIEQEFIEQMGEYAQEQKLLKQAVNEEPEKTNTPLLQRVRNSQFVRFFFPKIMPGDIVSKIYTDTFWFSFWTVLIIAFPYYLLGLSNNSYVQGIEKDIFGTLAFFVDDEKGYRQTFSNKSPHFFGDLFLIPCLYAWLFFDKNAKKIPPTVLGTPKERIRSSFSIWLFFPACYLFVKIGQEFEKHPHVSLYHLFLLLVFAGTYGFIGVNIARTILGLSAVTGWRKTVRSMWN